MSNHNFNISKDDVGDSTKYKVYVTSDSKTIHKAELYRIKKGWFGYEKLLFHADLMKPYRDVEGEIEALQIKLKLLEVKLATSYDEAINLINAYEGSIFDGQSFYSRLKSKPSKKGDADTKKKPTRSVTIGLVQGPKKPAPQSKQNNSNNQNNNSNQRKS